VLPTVIEGVSGVTAIVVSVGLTMKPLQPNKARSIDTVRKTVKIDVAMLLNRFALLSLRLATNRIIPFTTRHKEVLWTRPGAGSRRPSRQGYSTVSVIVVDAVIDDDDVSAPTIVRA
jgi:hypothetical protein